MKLTKAEEQIMQILWLLGEGTVQNIRERFEDSKPARTTIATLLSILENKKFIIHTTDGRTNIYKPVISKEDYSKKQLFSFLKNYFDGSFSSMASFFVKESKMTMEEMDRLLEETRKALKEENKKEK